MQFLRLKGAGLRSPQAKSPHPCKKRLIYDTHTSSWHPCHGCHRCGFKHSGPVPLRAMAHLGRFHGPLVTIRIAIGSGLAFLVAQSLDVAIFSALRQGKWWRAPLASTLIGSTVDTVLFFSIAFSGALSFIHLGTDGFPSQSRTGR